MRCRTILNSLKKHLFFVSLILVANNFAFGQIDVAITEAVALPTKENPNHWQVFVGFDKAFDLPPSITDVENPEKNPIKNPKNFYLVEIETGHRIEVIYTYFDSSRFYTPAGGLNGIRFPSSVTVYLDPSIRLDSKRHYHLYVLNIKFEGNLSKDPQPQKSVKFAPVVSAGNTTGTPRAETEQGDPAIRDSLSFTAADGREDANVYLSGQIVAAKKSKPNFTGDIKVEIPVKKIIGNRVHNFNPFFELKVGEGPDVDLDSMKFGLRWEFPAWRYRGENLKFPIRRVLLRNAPQIEAEKDWENVNFIIDSRLRFMSRTYSSKFSTLYFRPFVGVGSIEPHLCFFFG